MPSINVDALPSRIRTTVARDRDGVKVAPTLSQADLDLIVNTARGQQVQPALTRHRAIGLVADAAPPVVAVPLLSTIARDANESTSTRVVAVRSLGDVVMPEAQATLLDVARDVNPRVQQEAFRALGQSGDATTLSVLNGLAAPSDSAARKQLALAKTLIAFRAGRAEVSLEAVSAGRRRPAANEPARPIAIEVLSADRTASDLTRFNGPDFALRFSERGYRVGCGRKEWTLFVNAELGSLAAADRLRARPWLAGLLARWLPPDTSSATQLLLLTRPEGSGVRFDVVRTDGEIIYTGTGQPSGQGVAFDITDVDRPQTAPTSLVGVVTESGVQLEIARVLESRVSPRRAQPVRVAG